VKIMGIMIESNELNISEITRRSGISHSSVEVHLELLVKLGLLTEKRFREQFERALDLDEGYDKFLQKEAGRAGAS